MSESEFFGESFPYGDQNDSSLAAYLRKEEADGMKEALGTDLV
jgi:hypothetical protein